MSYREPPEVYRLAEKAADKDVHIQDQMWLRGSSHMTFLGNKLLGLDTKRDVFCDFLFGFLYMDPLHKRGLV